MRRRDFIVLLSGTAALPAPVWAQEKRVLLGVLVPANAEPFFGALKEGLRAGGYVEGRNLRLELRTADGKPDRLPGLARELVGMKVDVLVAWQTPAVHAAREATTTIPIAMSAGDPVGTGLIQSLARPGGNITGVTGTTAEMGGKTLEVIREMLPSAKRVAVLANAADPFTKPFLQQIEQAARAVSVELRPIQVRGVHEFDAAFSEFQQWRADAVIVQPSLPREAAIRHTLKLRLPSISAIRGFPEAGGLMSYSASNVVLSRELAVYVDKLLKGAKPADLPVQQATVYELVVNAKTAKALGISIPRSLLLRADHVIE